MINALTIDLEDYYFIVIRDFFNQRFEVSERTKECTYKMLKVLDKTQTKATFFVLGVVAKRFPELIREISQLGHEVASHGFEHIYWNKSSREEIKKDLINSKHILEDITGKEVIGYRAPAFGLSLDRLDDFALLAELGFKYDSSIFPIKGKRYGSPQSPLAPYPIKTEKGEIIEFPLCAVRFFNRNLPAAGGGYLRLFPLKYNLWAIKRNNKQGIMVTAYFHPYECDVHPLPINIKNAEPKSKRKFKIFHTIQCINRKYTLKKLEILCHTFTFAPISEILEKKLFKKLVNH